MSERPNPGREDGRDQTRHSLPVHSHALHDASQDSLTIKASHLPAPLLAQVDRLPGAFDYEVLQDGPEFWFVRITRTAL